MTGFWGAVQNTVKHKSIYSPSAQNKTAGLHSGWLCFVNSSFHSFCLLCQVINVVPPQKNLCSQTTAAYQQALLLSASWVTVIAITMCVREWVAPGSTTMALVSNATLFTYGPAVWFFPTLLALQISRNKWQFFWDHQNILNVHLAQQVLIPLIPSSFIFNIRQVLLTTQWSVYEVSI